MSVHAGDEHTYKVGFIVVALCANREPATLLGWVLDRRSTPQSRRCSVAASPWTQKMYGWPHCSVRWYGRPCSTTDVRALGAVGIEWLCQVLCQVLMLSGRGAARYRDVCCYEHTEEVSVIDVGGETGW